jgi:hypothetical protein
MKGPILAVLSLWRDSERYLTRSLNQFEAMEEELQECNIRVIYSFFENDSKDETPTKLLSWLKGRKGILQSERIDAPRWGSVSSLDRVRYQARYRNMALAPLNTYYNFDYLLVADSDVYWDPELITGMIDRLDANPSWGMISPNTVQNVRDFVEDTERKSYFDSWSLKDLDDDQCLTFAANPFLRPEDREAWDNDQPVSCNSAFGSIAMVKADALDCEDGVEWAVIDGVEHWEFCAGVRSNGYEVIADPTLHAEVVHNEEVVPHPDVVRFHQKRLGTALATS